MQTPLVMRVAEGEGRWRIVGECYVHGIMDGKVLMAGIEKELFEIV
jgi:hypothetical protein